MFEKRSQNLKEKEAHYEEKIFFMINEVHIYKFVCLKEINVKYSDILIY